MEYAGNASVPLYRDHTGALQADLDGIDLSGADGSGALKMGQQRHLGRLHNRIERLQGREQQLQSQLASQPGESGPTVYNADLRALAAQKGLIQENQFDGLGFITTLAGSSGATINSSLTDNLNRDCWIKSMVMSASSTSIVGVTAITVAGVPINIGSKTMPLETFIATSVRFGISFGRRLVRSGQAVTVSVTNISNATNTDCQAGLICDEMASYLVAGVAEAGLLAAVNGSGCGAY